MTMKQLLVMFAIQWLILLSGFAHADIPSPTQRFGDDIRITYSSDYNRIVTLGGIALKSARPSQGPRIAAEWFLQKHGDLFGLAQPGLKTSLKSTHFHLNQNIVHFNLSLDGLPVFLKRAVVQVDNNGRIRRVAADIPSTSDRRDPHPVPTKIVAREWAVRHGFPADTIAGPGWLTLGNSKPRPVVRISTPEELGQEPLILFLDASTGRVLHTEPIIWTSDPPAAVFPENPVTTPDVEIVPLLHLDDHTDKLWGAYARVATCVDKERCENTRPLALRSGSGDGHFVFKPSLEEYSFEDPFAEVNVYRNITSINSWARETFGWEGLFGDKTWIQIKVGRAWYNAAYYAGNEDRDPFLVFGQDTVDFAYDADVAFHEFGHAINRTIWEHTWFHRDELGINTSMFTLEEALADIWAQHFSGDPVMDSYILWSRTAQNNLTCPDTVMAEGHMEARILSGFAWDVREAIGETAWGHVFFRALNFLGSDVGFDKFATKLANSAQDLALEGAAEVTPEHADTILRLANKRGLLDEECLSRLVSLPEGTPRRVYGYGKKRMGGYHYPFGLQWKIETPEDAKAFKMFFYWRYPTEEEVEGVEPGFTVHLKRGSPVTVTWLDPEDLEKGDPMFKANADISFFGAPSVIDFPYLSLEPLTPGETIYVLISSATKESVVVIDTRVYFFSEMALPPESDEPDAGVRHLISKAGDGTPSCTTAHAAASKKNEIHSVLTGLITTLLTDFISQ
ncbi:MAG: M4 family metallopeptidase [Proteobacteria bacterium]|nr:M4 family metallopeptidase [Pseudomonadota bacterium]